MGIINDICGALHAELFRQAGEGISESTIRNVLVDYKTYDKICRDPGYKHYCKLVYPTVTARSPVLILMGYAIVPTYEVAGFQILLKGGILAPKAAKGTAQN